MNAGPDKFSAADRAARWHDEDPYPEIMPALLNADDIASYVNATGMIDPFRPGKAEDKMKAASYEVDLLGTCVYYDASGSLRKEHVGKGQPFVLEANSIAFVTLEPEFRLPTYIALRFNLRITHVYRGLLLGTGPLVDPGWSGRLSIPLHNLTTNPYRLVGGEGLIWVEFTKVSGAAASALPPRPGAPGRIKVDYKNKGIQEQAGKDVEYFLRKAEPHRPVQSGIPAATSQAAEAAREALATTHTFRNIAFIAGLGFVVGLGSLIFGVLNLLQSSNARVDELRGKAEQIDELRREVDELRTPRPTASTPSPGPTATGLPRPSPTP